ncbi:MAG: endo alpha-1,4 polygalactosaminidase [Vicinamibacterales bacterium]
MATSFVDFERRPRRGSTSVLALATLGCAALVGCHAGERTSVRLESGAASSGVPQPSPNASSSVSVDRLANLTTAIGGDRDALRHWAVCYTSRPSAADLAGYGVLVLDPDAHPPLAPLADRGQMLFAYLSLTEIARGRTFFPALQAGGLVLDRHPVWTESFYLDFRKPAWVRTIVEDLVPALLQQGFHGLFLDTLDDAAFLEAKDGRRYGGMRASAIALVDTIRRHYPDVAIMVNRGYDLLPDMAGAVDIVLAESVRGTFDPAAKTFREVEGSEADAHVARLHALREARPSLRIFTLDYWDPADTEGMRRLYAEQRHQGFVPYVSTPMLDRIVQEPK